MNTKRSVGYIIKAKKKELSRIYLASFCASALLLSSVVFSQKVHADEDDLEVTKTQTIRAEDTGTLGVNLPFGDQFGVHMDANKDWVAFGSPREAVEVDGNRDQGTVRLYKRTKNGLEFAQLIKPEAGTGNDRFGAGVTFAGNQLIVGAANDTGGFFEGRLYFYKLKKGVWVKEAQELTSSEPFNAAFGSRTEANKVAYFPKHKILVVAEGNDGAPEQLNVYKRKKNKWVVAHPPVPNPTEDNELFAFSLDTIVAAGDSTLVVEEGAIAFRIRNEPELYLGVDFPSNEIAAYAVNANGIVGTSPKQTIGFQKRAITSDDAEFRAAVDYLNFGAPLPDQLYDDLKANSQLWCGEHNNLPFVSDFAPAVGMAAGGGVFVVSNPCYMPSGDLADLKGEVNVYKVCDGNDQPLKLIQNLPGPSDSFFYGTTPFSGGANLATDGKRIVVGTSVIRMDFLVPQIGSIPYPVDFLGFTANAIPQPPVDVYSLDDGQYSLQAVIPQPEPQSGPASDTYGQSVQLLPSSNKDKTDLLIQQLGSDIFTTFLNPSGASVFAFRFDGDDSDDSDSDFSSGICDDSDSD